MHSEKGICEISGLHYRPNDDMGPQSLTAGTYEIHIKDVTKGLAPRLKMKHSKVLLKLADLDEEAAAVAAAAAQAAAAKGGKKK